MAWKAASIIAVAWLPMATSTASSGDLEPPAAHGAHPMATGMPHRDERALFQSDMALTSAAGGSRS